MPKIEEIYWRAECSFAESHKHGALAKAIKVSWAESVGIVAALYGQVRRQLPDGDLSGIDDDVLQRWCHSRKVTRAALVASGWVDPDGTVRGWVDRYSWMAEKRTAERLKKRRGRAADVPEMSPRERGQKGDIPVPRDGDIVPSVPSLRAIARDGDGDGDGDGEKKMGALPPGASAPSPEVQRLHETYLEATSRKPVAITPKAAQRLAELIGWSGSIEAAERGVRKIGASAWHRNDGHGKRNDNLLDSKPFRTADAFRGWCEEPIDARPATPAKTRGQILLDSVRNPDGSLPT